MILLKRGIMPYCFVVGVILYTIILSACSQKSNEQAEIESFQVITPIIKDTVYVREFVADIQSVQNTELRAKAAGFLESIHADEGEFVRVGQLLFTISRQQHQQEVLKAEAVLASTIAETKAAEVELKNARALVLKNIVSQSEVDLAQAQVDALQSKTEEARANLASTQLLFSYTQVRAPFSGYINRIPNKVGSLIEEGELLTTISNNDEMLVYFNVSEREYLDYTTNGNQRPLEVELVLANDHVYKYLGKVETAESEVDKSTGSIAFRARFKNPNQLLKHGSSGKIRTRTELKNAMLIPQKSTLEIQENLYVFAVNEKNMVSMKRFVPSLYLSKYYVVQSGLDAFDRFILEGVQRVKAGDVILPQVKEVAQTITNQ
jgi:RND family efflux transporter MFP subunit